MSKLLIATPAYGGQVTTPYLTCILNTYTHLIQSGLVDSVNLYTLSTESLISRGRNKCAHYALKHGYDRLLFIDADMGWRAEDVEKLLVSDSPIVGGTYPVKSFPIQLNFNPIGKYDAHDNPRAQENYARWAGGVANERGEVEVRHIPTGFMMIDTRVFRCLITSNAVEPYEAAQNDDGSVSMFHDFFPVRVKDGRYESEDWAFCSIAREAGFKVHLNTRIVCDHMGTHIYGLGQRFSKGIAP